MKKCFEGIAKLSFTDIMEATAMISSEGEKIVLEDVIDTTAARGQVEKWLLELETDMKKSVKAQVNRDVEVMFLYIDTNHYIYMSICFLFR